MKRENKGLSTFQGLFGFSTKERKEHPFSFKGLPFCMDKWTMGQKKTECALWVWGLPADSVLFFFWLQDYHCIKNFSLACWWSVIQTKHLNSLHKHRYYLKPQVKHNRNESLTPPLKTHFTQQHTPFIASKGLPEMLIFVICLIFVTVICNYSVLFRDRLKPRDFVVSQLRIFFGNC